MCAYHGSKLTECISDAEEIVKPKQIVDADNDEKRVCKMFIFEYRRLKDIPNDCMVAQSPPLLPLQNFDARCAANQSGYEDPSQNSTRGLEPHYQLKPWRGFTLRSHPLRREKSYCAMRTASRQL